MPLSTKIWIRFEHLPSGKVLDSVKNVMTPELKLELEILLESVNKMNYLTFFPTLAGKVYIPSTVIQQSVFTIMEKVVNDKDD